MKDRTRFEGEVVQNFVHCHLKEFPLQVHLIVFPAGINIDSKVQGVFVSVLDKLRCVE
jgi:hypothetical protein